MNLRLSLDAQLKCRFDTPKKKQGQEKARDERQISGTAMVVDL